ncbi:MAG TPA: hypothetical protein VHR45_23285 [Thermoanaerobaculia bacterium]|nr:hypothetical protein [Thermoanaerobaculia bacterium]
MPPALWTDLPTPSPTVVTSTRVPIMAKVTTPMSHLLLVNHSPLGPRM